MQLAHARWFALGLALPALVACQAPPAEPGAPRVGGDSPIALEIERVADEEGVPAEYLAAIAWVESRFSTHPDEASELGGHGMMRLTEGDTLEEAQALTGASRDALIHDPAVNLQGAAAVLAARFERHGSWPAAIASYGPGSIDEAAGVAYAERVVHVARVGASGVDGDGASLFLTAAPSPVEGEVDEELGAVRASLRPDYAGARWVGPACRGNYTNASRGPSQIRDIVIHTCQGAFSGCWGWLRNCASGVSAHYVISSAGEVVQLVEEEDIAYHDGCFNSGSIGIEHEGFVAEPGRWYTEAMYCESARLVRSICDRQRVTCTRAHVRGHGETPDCSDHTDPGRGWNWTKYMEYVNCGCEGCCTASAETCDGEDEDCDGAVDEGDVCEIALLHDQIHAYARPSTTDVDADGSADVCGRGHSGVWCHFAREGGWSEKSETRPAWGNDDGWDDPSNYATFRMGDVDGDGHADLCARANRGVHCYLGSDTGLDGPGSGPWAPDAYADAGGWNRPEYYTTLRLADVNGDGMEDLCARGAAGFFCRISDGTSFGERFEGPELSDEGSWNRARYYGTVRMGDLDGDGRSDLCARAAAGMRCWLAEETAFAETAIVGPEWSNANGWNDPSRWSTIRLADVDGDGHADLCGRSAEGLACHFFREGAFGPAVEVAAYGDDSGWADISNYATLRTGDIDADGAADLCIRGNAGMRCHRWDGAAFVRVAGPDWSDDSGWDSPNHFHSITLADVNADGRHDLCARASAGWRCALSTGDGFGDAQTLDEFTNEGGWRAPAHRRTLLSGGPRCRRLEETCNGADDDCDGAVDEGLDCTPDAGPGPVDASAVDADAGVAPGDASLPEPDGRVSGDCGCRAAGRPADGLPPAWLLLAPLAYLLRRSWR
ncbi:MAG: hypothetical protein SangKO_091290 [Sandaracinaceae bacterium]